MHYNFMKTFKRTKIVCTIGPASASVSTLKKMIREGMNVARLNFSHGTYTSHLQLIRNIRKASKEMGVVVAILQDLSGPKLRVGDVGDGVELIQGEVVVFSSVSRKGVIPVDYERLEKDVKKGEHILLDDGTIEVVVEKAMRSGLRCRVIVGGLLKSHKGFNLPGSTLRISAITKKDERDLAFGLKHGVDFIALSFVRHAKEVNRLKKMIVKSWDSKRGVAPAVIAKIEKLEALENIEKIVKAVDGIMVARGDLGIETPASMVPVRQKEIISLMRSMGKPVIVATEMLASMVERPRPTRAEVSDVAHAVIDHTDAVMLSGESATGKYPVAAVKMMSAVAHETEDSMYDDVRLCATGSMFGTQHRTVGALVALLVEQKDIVAVLLPPESVGLVSQISFFRPEVPVVVGCDHVRLIRKSQLVWGTYVLPKVIAHPAGFMKEIFVHARRLRIKQSDVVAMIHQSGTTLDLFVGPLRSIGR